MAQQNVANGTVYWAICGVTCDRSEGQAPDVREKNKFFSLTYRVCVANTPPQESSL